MRAAPVLSASHLSHRFGARVALVDVSLEVRPGEVVGLLGPNGAGKTSLIRACCGLLRPLSGTVRVAGVDPGAHRREAARSFGYMPQSSALYEDLSVSDNARFFAALHGLTGASRAARVAEALAEVELTDRRHDRVYALSGGLRQRLSLACAMLHRPAVLFLDEPTVGLDPRVRRQIWALFFERARAGAAIVVSTHQMDEAAYCRRLVLMWEGRVLRDAPVRRSRAGASPLEDEFLRLIGRARAEAA